MSTLHVLQNQNYTEMVNAKSYATSTWNGILWTHNFIFVLFFQPYQYWNDTLRNL